MFAEITPDEHGIENLPSWWGDDCRLMVVGKTYLAINPTSNAAYFNFTHNRWEVVSISARALIAANQ